MCMRQALLDLLASKDIKPVEGHEFLKPHATIALEIEKFREQSDPDQVKEHLKDVKEMLAAWHRMNSSLARAYKDLSSSVCKRVKDNEKNLKKKQQDEAKAMEAKKIAAMKTMDKAGKADMSVDYSNHEAIETFQGDEQAQATHVNHEIVDFWSPQLERLMMDLRTCLLTAI